MQLAGLADVFVNDAFGSWQPHVSTLGVTKMLFLYAGLLMQKELKALDALLRPTRPFLAVIAGAKLDTKIGTVKAVARRCDALMLGGQLYNAYLAAKFGITVRGVDPGGRRVSRGTSYWATRRSRPSSCRCPLWWRAPPSTGAGAYRATGCAAKTRLRTRREPTEHVRDLVVGREYGYFLDVAPESFAEARVKEALSSRRPSS